MQAEIEKWVRCSKEKEEEEEEGSYMVVFQLQLQIPRLAHTSGLACNLTLQLHYWCWRFVGRTRLAPDRCESLDLPFS